MFIHRSSNDSPHPPALPNLAPQEDQLYTWGANANGQLGPLGFHPIHPMKKWMTGGIPVVGNIHIIHKYIYIYIIYMYIIYVYIYICLYQGLVYDCLVGTSWFHQIGYFEHRIIMDADPRSLSSGTGSVAWEKCESNMIVPCHTGEILSGVRWCQHVRAG